MPRVAKQTATLASLMDDLSDDELAYTQLHKDAPAMPTPDSAAENKAPIIKKRGPANAKAPFKTAPKKKTAAAIKNKAVEEEEDMIAPTRRGGKRSALEELPNVKGEGPAQKRAKATVKSAPTKRAAKKIEEEVVEEEENQPEQDHSLDAAEDESKGEVMSDVEASIEENAPQLANPKRRVHSVPQSQTKARPAVRGNSRALSTERSVGDAALRRRLGDITSKYDNLELKYSQLKETASTDAQSNFDKLKSATERQVKTQETLVSTLRKQIAAQKDSVSESRTLKSKLAESQVEVERLKADKLISAAEIKSLKEAATKSQNEIKALQAKLAASRAHSEQPQSKSAGRNAPPSASAASAMAGLKEDLYCDVTGLLIHGVKKTDRRTVYDCSQTGRNGTLRFQFTIDEIDLSTMTPGASIFDDAQVTYTPLLDDKNDQQLYDILQDFLLEEIEFPRSSLEKLYTSIRDGMQKPVIIQDDSEDESQDDE